MVALYQTMRHGIDVFNIRNLAGWQAAINSGNIKTAVEDAAGIALSLNVPLYIPAAAPTSGTFAGVNLPFNSTITLPPNSSLIVDMLLPMVYTGTLNEPAIVYGDEEELSSDCVFRCRVKRNTMSDWTNEASVGIRLINCTRMVEIFVGAEFFTIGVQMLSSGDQFAHNKFVKLDLMRSNRYNIDCQRKRRVSDLAQGYFNENTVEGGQFSTHTGAYAALGSPSDKQPVGVRFSAFDVNATNSINNNTFRLLAFELDQNWPQGAIPWLIDATSLYNTMVDCRVEHAVTSAFLKITPNANVVHNKGSVQYHNSLTITNAMLVDDQGQFNYNNRVTTLRSDLDNVGATSRPVDEEFCRRLTLYKKTGQVSIPGWGWRTHGVSGLQVGSNWTTHTVTSGALTILTGNNSGPARRYRTTTCKEILVEPYFLTGFGGRVMVQCFDAAGAVLGGTFSGRVGSSTGQFYCKGARLNWSTLFGGCFLAFGNTDQRHRISLHDDVKYIEIAYCQVSIEARLLGMNVYGINGHLPNITPLPIDEHRRLVFEWPENRNATATCTVNAGAIDTVTPVQVGGSYAVAPIVTVSGGGGSGAVLTATVSSLSAGGSVTNIAITNGGTGYTSAPTLTLTEAPDKTVAVRGEAFYYDQFTGGVADVYAWVRTSTGQYDAIATVPL